MTLKFLKILVAMLLVSALLTACGRNRDNDEDDYDYIDPPQVEEPEPQPGPGPGPDTEPEPDPEPEPSTLLTAISIPIIAGFEELSDGGNYLVDMDVDGEYLEHGNEIFIGWDGVDTLFVRTTFRNEAGIAVATSLMQNEPAEGESGRAMEVREHSISFLGNNEGFVDWAGILDAELLRYINMRGYVHGQIVVNTVASTALLGDTGGYLQFDFQQPDMTVISIPVVAGFDDFANLRDMRFALLADGGMSDANHRVQVAWNGRSTVFMRFVVHHPHSVIYNSRAANATDWRRDDIVEVVMLPSVSANDAQNRSAARHWAANSETVFLNTNSTANFVGRSGFADDVWTVDIALPLDQEMREVIYANGYVYGSIAVLVNSAGEEFILGATGQFWDADTFLRFVFEDAEHALQADVNPFEVKPGFNEEDKFCEP